MSPGRTGRPTASVAPPRATGAAAPGSSLVVLDVDLGPGVEAWFTGRGDGWLQVPPGDAEAVGQPGNLSHRRPHQPAELAATRRWVGALTATRPTDWHLLDQLHGAAVATVDAATPVGAQLPRVDAAVTTLAARPLVVQVADCVPVLFAGPRSVGVVHAGRRGVEQGVVGAAVRAAEAAGDRAEAITAVIGPAIGGCCYEVPATMQQDVCRVVDEARATTSWGTPSLDLPSAVRRQLLDAGLRDVTDLGSCTRCDASGRWFSHRADPASGRQIGLVVRRDGVRR